MPELDPEDRCRRFVLLVDHGSRSDRANHRLTEIGSRLQEFYERNGPTWGVAVAHMELAQPDIPSVVAELVNRGAEELVIVPCLLSPGRHVAEDIPRIVGEALLAHPGLRLRFAPPLSELPGFIAFLAQASEV